MLMARRMKHGLATAVFCSGLFGAWNGVLVASDSAAAVAGQSVPLPEPQRVFVCGHSFHVFIHKPLARIAQDRGFTNHVDAGMQYLAASMAETHWKYATHKDPRRRVRRVMDALESGRVDVLTLSPNAKVPDPGIDKFVALGLQHNPKMRFMVQQSWPVADLQGKRLTEQARDKVTIDDLLPYALKQQQKHLAQIRRINEKIGRSVAFHVPVVFGVLKLREAVRKGEAPKVERQSQLFRDLGGHPRMEIELLAAYMHFACIYRLSPVGCRAFKRADDPEWNALDELLQRTAWETVCEQPLTGLTVAAETKAEKR
jgi:hypothetical protein